MLRKKFFIFLDDRTGKILCKLSVEGVFPGELKATRELLSHDLKIPETFIKLQVI